MHVRLSVIVKDVEFKTLRCKFQWVEMLKYTASLFWGWRLTHMCGVR